MKYYNGFCLCDFAPQEFPPLFSQLQWIQTDKGNNIYNCSMTKKNQCKLSARSYWKHKICPCPILYFALCKYVTCCVKMYQVWKRDQTHRTTAESRKRKDVLPIFVVTYGQRAGSMIHFRLYSPLNEHQGGKNQSQTKRGWKAQKVHAMVKMKRGSDT